MTNQLPEKLVPMTTQQYQNFVAQTAVFPPQFGSIYCALKLAGEAGETAEKIGKAIRDDGAYTQDNTVSLNRLQRDNIKSDCANTYLTDEQLQKLTPRLNLSDEKKFEILKELGDVLWYVTALSMQLGYTLDDVITANVDKLTSRRDRGKIGGSGDNR